MENNITIRACTIDDIEAIYRLNRDEMHYEYPLELTAEKLEKVLRSDSERIFIAELDGEAVGYIHACNYDLLYAPHMKNIMGVAVLNSCKRMGIGRLLINAVERWAFESGASAIRLCSGEERNDAHEFYKSCGFIFGKKQLNFRKELCK